MPKTPKNNQNQVTLLQDIFTQNFLMADNYYKQHLADQISKNDYLKIKANFIKSWFKEKCPEKVIPDDYQCAVIADHSKRTLVAARAGSGKTTTMVAKAYFLIKHCHVPPEEIMLLAFNRSAAFSIKERLFLLLADVSTANIYEEEIKLVDSNQIGDKEKIIQRVIGRFSQRIPQIYTFHALALHLANVGSKFSPEGNSINLSILDQAIYKLFNSTNGSKYLCEFMYLSCTHFAIEFTHDEYNRKHYRSLNGINLSSSMEVRLANYLFTRSVPYLYHDPKSVKDTGIFELQGQFGPFYITITSNDISTPLNEFKEIDLIIFGKDQERSIPKMKITNKLGKNVTDQDNEIIISNVPDNLYQRFTPEVEQQLNQIILRRLNFEPVKIDLYTIFYNSKYAQQRFKELAEKFISLSLNHNNSPKEITEMVINYQNKFKEKNNEREKKVKSFEFIMIKLFELYEDIREGLDLHDFLSIFRAAQQNLIADPNKNFANSISHLIIDEYQDFTPLYHLLIKTILQQNKNIHLCCVGDDWQAINGYSGSDLTYYEKFNTFFKSSTHLDLPCNYRSCKEVVAYSNMVNNRQGKKAIAVKTEPGKLYFIDASELQIRNINSEISNIAIARMLKYPEESVAILTRTQYQISLFKKIKERFPQLILSTIHGFKGLEADTVIIDITKSYFEGVHPDSPFFYSIGINQELVNQEEERLVYVGLTRAKSNLYLIYPDLESRCTYTFTTDKDVERLKLLKSEYDPITTIEILAEFDQEIKNQITAIVNIGYENKDKLKAAKYRYNPTDHSWYKNFSNMDELNKELKASSWYPLEKSYGSSLIVKNYLGKIIRKEPQPTSALTLKFGTSESNRKR